MHGLRNVYMPENENGEYNPNKAPAEQGNPDSQNVANTPKLPKSLGGESWYQRPHDELVKAFRDHIQLEEKRYGGHWSAEEIIRARLDIESKSRQFNDDKLNDVKRNRSPPHVQGYDALTRL